MSDWNMRKRLIIAFSLTALFLIINELGGLSLPWWLILIPLWGLPLLILLSVGAFVLMSNISNRK